MYRVLIADDEPIERQVISKKLNGFFKDQIEIFLAANGVEAVELVKEKNCQIAFLDISMPGKNGLDAAEEIRTFDERCSIIFLTAFDEFSYAKKAIEVRALDYLLKPGADNELINVMEEAFSIADKYETEVKNVDTIKKLTPSSDFNLDFSQVDGLDAFIVTDLVSDGTLMLQKVEKVPANTAVLVCGTQATSYQVPTSASAASVSSASGF